MKKVGLLVAVLAVALAVPALAFGPGGFGGGPGSGKCGHGPQGSGWDRGPGFERGHGGGGLGGLGRMAAYLNLSKEQMDKMFQVTTKYQDEVRQTRYDLFQKRLNARKLFTDPKADNATILAKEKEISALQQKIHDRMVQMRLEQRNILTPEQLQKLNEAPMGFGPRGREGSRS